MNAEVSNHSDENGMNFDYNFNVDADDFNVLMNGKVKGQPTDFNFNMETTYTKAEVFFLIPYMGLDARKPSSGVCEQQRCRPACLSVQSDQCLCCSLIGKYSIQTCYKLF